MATIGDLKEAVNKLEERFNEFLSNHFFHLKVEVRVNSIINVLLLGGIVALIILLVMG